MREFDPSVLFGVIDLVGVVGNGLLGAAVARQMKFDLVGFTVVALLSGLGGGMIRDVMLDAGPPVALTNPAYLSCAVSAAAIGYIIDLQGRWSRWTLALIDVLAVGCWSATGAGKALGVGLGAVPAVFLGVTTAVGGGALRDITVGRLPAIFLSGSPLYAVIAMAGAIEMVIFDQLGMPDAGMGLAIVTCVVLGLAARRLKWTLPRPLSMDVRSLRPPPLRRRPKD
ncbi:trimeric intracellular cation channel family protein [Nigerium massiliense]|uniref:trimeric intracellular cation channel family protein n=1 Tax=Nigerium massiliense TaxID=1522317 RepID=UPI00058F707E|nr:TRIC cation channel family protein [Nigerium massiliense]